MLPKRYHRLLIVLLATGLLLNGFVAWSDRDLILKGYPDFTGLYVAGKILDNGQGARLYDLGLQYRLQLQFASHVSIRHGALPYVHPPFEALVFAPFALLPYIPAYIAWNALSLAILALLILLLRKYSPMLRGSPLILWVLASVAYFPVFICLLQGQDMQLLLLAMAGSYAALKAGKDFTAGFCLGLALFRPQLVLPLIFLLLVGQVSAHAGKVLAPKIRFSAGVVLAGSLEFVLSILVSGWKGTLFYPSYVWTLERNRGYGAIVPADMPNIRGLVSAFFPDGHAVALALTASISVVLLISAATSLRRAQASTPVELRFAFATTAAVLISYHAFMYDLEILLLASSFLLAHWQDERSRQTIESYLLLGPIAVLFCTPLLMLLWLRMGRLNLLAPILLVWLWAISREMSREQFRESTWAHA